MATRLTDQPSKEVIGRDDVAAFEFTDVGPAEASSAESMPRAARRVRSPRRLTSARVPRYARPIITARAPSARLHTSLPLETRVEQDFDLVTDRVHDRGNARIGAGVPSRLLPP